jgi:hypothetical protein
MVPQFDRLERHRVATYKLGGGQLAVRLSGAAVTPLPMQRALHCSQNHALLQS